VAIKKKMMSGFLFASVVGGFAGKGDFLARAGNPKWREEIYIEFLHKDYTENGGKIKYSQLILIPTQLYRFRSGRGFWREHPSNFFHHHHHHTITSLTMTIPTSNTNHYHYSPPQPSE
jgi:hypothetical protein